MIQIKIRLNETDKENEMNRVYVSIGKKIGIVAVSLALTLVMVQASLAAAVDRDLAWTVANNYLEYLVQTFDRWPEADPFIESLTPVFYKETKVFWHIDVSPSGFLLISPRDELSPIKLYSETGRFDPDRATKMGAPESWIIPEQFLSVVAVSFATKIRAPLQGDEGVSRQIRLAWNLFGQPGEWKAFSKTSAHPPRTVGPLVTARWGQDAPYNLHTPKVEGENTLVGCVATAWSMLLRHWQWPKRGRGVKTHVWQGQELTVDFGAQTWNWGVMPDVITTDSFSEAIDSVALLGYQVGVAAEMDWGLEGSGSDLYADEVLHLYFRYRDGMRRLQRGEFSAEDWFAAFREDFDAPTPRPIAMSIFGDNGGHEILADGYQTGPTNMVHLNMGWDGMQNAWYDVTSDFVTGEWPWRGISSVIVTGIEPDRSNVWGTPAINIY